MYDLIDLLNKSIALPDTAEGRNPYAQIGKITNIDDSKTLCRVKAQIAGQISDETEWLSCLSPGGLEGIPNKNDPCLVFPAMGDIHKGFVLFFPQSTTQNRPNHGLIWADAFLPMFNALTDQVLQIAQVLNDLIIQYNAHTHPTSMGPTSVTGTLETSSVTKPNVGHAQNADGSDISPSNNAAKVVSPKVKIR